MENKPVIASIPTPAFMAESIRFIAGGLTTMCVCWGSCIALIELLSVHYLIANNIATFIAWGYSYFLNKHFVFRNKENKHVEHGIKFIALQASLLALTNLNLFILVDLFHLHYLPSIIGNAVLVTLLNFFALKLVVFKQGKQKPSNKGQIE
jgi:putative flippase GtrA